MIFRRALLPVATFALAAMAWAAPASADPVARGARPVGHTFHGGTAVHAEVVVPVRRGPRAVVVPGRRHGHYEVRLERFWIPEEIVAYDVFGHPVVRPGYWAEREVRVWVPHRRRGRVMRRPAPRRPGPYGHVAVGITFP